MSLDTLPPSFESDTVRAAKMRRIRELDAINYVRAAWMDKLHAIYDLDSDAAPYFYDVISELKSSDPRLRGLEDIVRFVLTDLIDSGVIDILPDGKLRRS